MNIYDQFIRFFRRDFSASLDSKGFILKDIFYNTSNVHEYFTYISLVLIALLAGVYCESMLIFYPSFLAWIIAQVHMFRLYFMVYHISTDTSLDSIQRWPPKERESTIAASWYIIAIYFVFYSSYALFKHRNVWAPPFIGFALHLTTLFTSLNLLLNNHQFHKNNTFGIGFAVFIVLCYKL